MSHAATFSLPPFELLVDEQPRKGRGLPDWARKVYGGDWVIPEKAHDPYVVSNFVTSRDGRVSYGMPGQAGGGEIGGHNLHDRWIMAMLRARSDAVVIGDNTLRIEPEHVWTAEFIFPEDKSFFSELRQTEYRQDQPVNCFVSFSGRFNPDCAVFKQEIPIVIGATAAAAEEARRCGLPSHVEIVALGEDRVNMQSFFRYLKEHHGIGSILTEGGPGLYASCLADGAVDDEFLTLSPRFVGEPVGSPRPSLLEGSGFSPANSPACRLKSLRKAGDFLYLQSAIEYGQR